MTVVVVVIVATLTDLPLGYCYRMFTFFSLGGIGIGSYEKALPSRTGCLTKARGQDRNNPVGKEAQTPSPKREVSDAQGLEKKGLSDCQHHFEDSGTSILVIAKGPYSMLALHQLVSMLTPGSAIRLQVLNS